MLAALFCFYSFWRAASAERQTARVISFSCLSVWCCTAWNWVTRHFTLLICQKAGSRLLGEKMPRKIEAASAGAKHQRGNWCRHCIISCLQSRFMVEWGKTWENMNSYSLEYEVVQSKNPFLSELVQLLGEWRLVRVKGKVGWYFLIATSDNWS